MTLGVNLWRINANEYLITETNTTPEVNDANWSITKPT